MRDTYMDCPERERSSYLGDSSNQIGETFYSLDENSYAMTKKLMLTSLGWTTTNNEIPLRSPSTTTNENPGQTLSFLASVWEYYLYTGDAETVRLFYPLAVNYLKLWNLNEDGTVVYRNGSFNWVDWGSGYDQVVLQNAFYYYGLSSISKLANALNITTDFSFFTERMQKVKTGFAKFKKDGGYTSGTAYDDRANAMAVVAGLADLGDAAEYAMRTANKHFYYAFSRSNLVNGLAHDTEVPNYVPWWKTALNAAVGVTAALTAVAGVLYIGTLVIDELKKRGEN